MVTGISRTTLFALVVTAAVALVSAASAGAGDDFWAPGAPGMRASTQCTPPPVCEECLYLDTYSANTDPAHVTETVTTQNVLENGALYRIVIVGTASYWFPPIWSDPVGNPEAAPMYPSTGGAMTGPVGVDWEFLFAYPIAKYCPYTLPHHFHYGQISTDGGTIFSSLEPISGPDYSPSHSYTYIVLGQGQKASFQRVDEGPHHDNYGRFYICVTKLIAAHCSS